MFTDFNKYAPDSISLDVHSIYWTVGILIVMESISNGCVRVISAKSMTAQHQLQLIEKYKVNILNPTPGNLVQWVKYERISGMDLSSVQYIFVHGGKSSLNFIPDVKRYFPNACIDEYFGITEIGLISIASLDNSNANVGGHRITSNNIVKIVDDDENRCGPNSLGEIRVKKPYEFLGYLNDPVQTANAVDDEGFFQTGDIGQFNDQGFLFITDRKKNIFSVFYYRNMILPQEIEECLAKMPDIKEVCVVGIPIVSQYFLPAVVVVRMPGSKLSQRDVYNAIAGSLSRNFEHGVSKRKNWLLSQKTSQINQLCRLKVNSGRFSIQKPQLFTNLCLKLEKIIFCRKFPKSCKTTLRSLFC